MKFIGGLYNEDRTNLKKYYIFETIRYLQPHLQGIHH